MSFSSISVVIPAYNESDAIGACLASLVAQSDDIHEIIVVDNNSSDDTAMIVKEVARDNGKVIALLEPRQGLPYARNTGLDAATGTVLARIDADTRVEPGWARAILDFFDRHGEVYAAGSGTCIAYDLPFQDKFLTAQQDMARSIREKLDAGDDADAPRLFGSNMAITRAAWEIIGPRTSLRTDIFEDVDLTLCAADAGMRCAVIPGATAQISGRRFKTGLASYLRYCWCDQRTFALHGQRDERRRAVLTLISVTLPFYFAMWIPFRAWDPSSRRFSLRSLLGRG